MATFDLYYQSRVQRVQALGNDLRFRHDSVRESKVSGPSLKRSKVKGLVRELTELAMTCLSHERIEESHQLLEEASRLSAFVSTRRSSAELKAITFAAKAEHARICGQPSLALELYRKAIKLVQPLRPLAFPRSELPWMYINLSHSLAALNKLDGALRYAQLAVRWGQEDFMEQADTINKGSRKKVNGRKDSMRQSLLILAVSYHNLSYCLERNGREDSSRKWQKRAVEAVSKVTSAAKNLKQTDTSYEQRFRERIIAETKSAVLRGAAAKSSDVASDRRRKKIKKRHQVSKKPHSQKHVSRMVCIPPGLLRRYDRPKKRRQCMRQRSSPYSAKQRPKTSIKRGATRWRAAPDLDREIKIDCMDNVVVSTPEAGGSNVYSHEYDAASLSLGVVRTDNGRDINQPEDKRSHALEVELNRIRDVHTQLLAVVEAQKKMITDQCLHFQALLSAGADLQRSLSSPEHQSAHLDAGFLSPAQEVQGFSFSGEPSPPKSPSTRKSTTPKRASSHKRKSPKTTKKDARIRRGSKDDHSVRISWTSVPMKQGLVDAETLFTCKRRDSPLKVSLLKPKRNARPKSKARPQRKQHQRGSKDDRDSHVSWIETSEKDLLIDKETQQRSKQRSSPVASARARCTLIPPLANGRPLRFANRLEPLHPMTGDVNYASRQHKQLKLEVGDEPNDETKREADVKAQAPTVSRHGTKANEGESENFGSETEQQQVVRPRIAPSTRPRSQGSKEDKETTNDISSEESSLLDCSSSEDERTVMSNESKRETDVEAQVPTVSRPGTKATKEIENVGSEAYQPRPVRPRMSPSTRPPSQGNKKDKEVPNDISSEESSLLDCSSSVVSAASIPGAEEKVSHGFSSDSSASSLVSLSTASTASAAIKVETNGIHSKSGESGGERLADFTDWPSGRISTPLSNKRDDASISSASQSLEMSSASASVSASASASASVVGQVEVAEQQLDGREQVETKNCALDSPRSFASGADNGGYESDESSQLSLSSSSEIDGVSLPGS